MKITTYRIDSALSFDKRYAAKSRMDVVSKTFTRMAQEILAKQERTSGTLILSSLAKASTNSKQHVQRANATGRFLLQDMNELLTLSRRVFTSFNGGTMPTGQAGMGVTDLMISPEIEEELRAMAYNPINTKGSPIADNANAETTTKSSADNRNTAFITAPDAVRVGLFNGGGVSSFYGVNLMVFNEFGVGRKFNKIFETVSNGTNFAKAPIGSSATAFSDSGKDELILGINRNRESLIRAIAVDSETGSEFSLVADDQYSIRQGKIGYFGSLEEGRMVLDNRALFGKIVTQS
jgi:hypothetical protein